MKSHPDSSVNESAFLALGRVWWSSFSSERFQKTSGFQMRQETWQWRVAEEDDGWRASEFRENAKKGKKENYEKKVKKTWKIQKKT